MTSPTQQFNVYDNHVTRCFFGSEGAIRASTIKKVAACVLFPIAIIVELFAFIGGVFSVLSSEASSLEGASYAAHPGDQRESDFLTSAQSASVFQMGGGDASPGSGRGAVHRFGGGDASPGSGRGVFQMGGGDASPAPDGTY